jgi:hypothetical protein
MASSQDSTATTASTSITTSTTSDDTINQLTDGFLAVAYSPLDVVTNRINEVDSELTALHAQLVSQGHERAGAAADDALVTKIGTTMERLVHYHTKAQRLARDMAAVHEKVTSLRRRMAVIEQKRTAANAQVLSSSFSSSLFVCVR